VERRARRRPSRTRAARRRAPNRDERGGAVAGNILGALLGAEAIPARWLDQLELRAEIEAVASDLYRRFVDPGAIGFDELVEEGGALRMGVNPAYESQLADLARYPPW